MTGERRYKVNAVRVKRGFGKVYAGQWTVELEEWCDWPPDVGAELVEAPSPGEGLYSFTQEEIEAAISALRWVERDATSAKTLQSFIAKLRQGSSTGGE